MGKDACRISGKVISRTYRYIMFMHIHSDETYIRRPVLAYVYMCVRVYVSVFAFMCVCLFDRACMYMGVFV